MEHRSGLEPDRAGLQSATSTASAFSAQNQQQTLAGEEGLEPSNARVRAECSGRCATPQFPGCGSRYRAGLSASSEQRFHLISFPASNRPPSSILVSGCRMSSCDGRTLAGARGIEPPSRHRQCPILAAGRRAQSWYPAPDSNRNLEFRRLAS